MENIKKRVRQSAPFKTLRGLQNPFTFASTINEFPNKQDYRDVVRAGAGTFEPANYDDQQIRMILLYKWNLDAKNPANDSEYIKALKKTHIENNMTSSDWKLMIKDYKDGRYPFNAVPQNLRSLLPMYNDYIIQQLLNYPDIIKEYVRIQRGGKEIIPEISISNENKGVVSTTSTIPNTSNILDVSNQLDTTNKSAGINYILIGALVIGGYLFTRKKTNAKRR